jgi:pimeloyl-ACP methyl ester carboxylesterase
LASVYVACAMLSGCGGSDATSAPDLAQGMDLAPPPCAVPPPKGAPTMPAWSDCGPPVGWQCATITVPRDWSDPSAGETHIFLRRLAAAPQTAAGQVWALQGGPGMSAEALRQYANQVRGTYPATRKLDFFVADARGTGQSDPIDCPDLDGAAWSRDGSTFVDPATRCVQQLGGALKYYTTTQDARDVGEMARALAQPGQKPLLWAVSYGGARAMRILELYPDLFGGAVLDSSVPRDMDYLAFDGDTDSAAQTLFEACGADPTCGANLGVDPWATFGDTLKNLDGGSCPTSENYDGVTWRHLFGGLMLQPRIYAELLPAAVYRARRCSAADQAALVKMGQFVRASIDGADPSFSAAIHLQIVLNELFLEQPPTLQEVVSGEQALSATTWNAPEYRATWDVWPHTYDQCLREYRPIAVPLLMLHGELDARVGIARGRALAAHYTGAGQTFVEVPRAGHVVAGDLSIGFCGYTMVGQFLNDPTAAVNTSCLSTVTPYHFSGNLALNVMTIFGTMDAWN